MIKIFLKNLPNSRWWQFITISFFLFSSIQVTCAQSHAEIRNVDFAVRNDSLFVTYDLDRATKQEKFTILLKITTASGKVVTPYTLSGDVGLGITGGKAKQIIWNISNDNIVIDDEIAVEVFATPLKPESGVKFVTRGKAVLLSALVPGLGLTKLNNGGPYWIMAIAVYGTAASSFLFYSLADQNYTKYLDAQTESDRNNLHSTALSQQNISNILLYSAGAVWLGNMIWTLASPNKTQSGDKGISFGGSYDPFAKTPVITVKYKF